MVCAFCGTWHEENAIEALRWRGVCIGCQGVYSVRFPSKAEARRYAVLRIEEKNKSITVLEAQPEFPIWINGVKVCTYKADFAYFRDQVRVIEDVKSGPTKTAVYRLKKKLVEASYPGVKIVEIEAT